MITIHGQKDSGNEYEAAKALAKAATKFAPEIEDSKQIILDIFTNVQCFGQKIQDVDLLVFFADYRQQDKLYLSNNKKTIHSFCLTIEVKGHSPESVKFIGSNCYVTYNGQEHNVTSQSESQKYSVRDYIGRNSKNKNSPWIHNLIWLINCPSSNLPKIETNIIGSDSSWPEILNKISSLGHNADKEVKTFTSHAWMQEIKSIFSKKLESSKVDRKRLEAITQTVLNRTKQKYAENLGDRFVHLSGQGGTGKTVRLLQIANQAYTEYGFRVVLLTYNKALVADIKRLLTIQGIGDSVGEPGMSVKTIHSFMRLWLKNLGVLDTVGNNFIENYEGYKHEALEMLEKGVITSNDIKKAKVENGRELAWDLILIDESQDWPQTERDLLYKLYDFKQFVIAEGAGQFVRGVTRINWRENIPSSDVSYSNLKKSLRLKASLCKTVCHFAEEIELMNWVLEPVPESPGGKVIVVVGNALPEEFHKRIIATSNHDGNKPIDMLFCVPPSWVIKKHDGSRESLVAKAYKDWGYKVWDAVDPQFREEYPTSVEQFRIVQYESCRGLEGWVVCCFDFDKFYEFKKLTSEISESEKSDMFFDENESATKYAKRWLMIPLTRAIDTLVLHVSDKNSYVGTILQNLRNKYPEDVEWIEYT